MHFYSQRARFSIADIREEIGRVTTCDRHSFSEQIADTINVFALLFVML